MKHTLPRPMQAGRHPVRVTLWLTEDEGMAFDQLVFESLARPACPILRARLLYDLVRNHIVGSAGPVYWIDANDDGQWLATVLSVSGACYDGGEGGDDECRR